VYDAGADLALHAEASLAVRIGAQRRIVGYAAALELVDFVDESWPRTERLVADLTHRAVAFGPTRPRLSAVDGRLVINGHVRAGAFLEGGYVDLLTRLSDDLSARGESLLRGDWVVTGPIVRAPVRPGDHVVADLGPLGHAAIAIA
jgi:2-keto-4-pentenoate hydratase